MSIMIKLSAIIITPRIIPMIDNAFILWQGRQHFCFGFPETDPESVFLTISSQDHSIVVVDEFSLRTIHQLNRLCSSPGDLHHRAEGVRGWSADGAGCHHVADIDIASVN